MTMVPDLGAAHAFYGGVFGWDVQYRPRRWCAVSGVAPQIGMTTRLEAGPASPGVILCYRVDDMATAVVRGTRRGRPG